MPSDRKSKTTRTPVVWLLAVLLAYGPYAQGLFFEHEYLYVQFATGLLALAAAWFLLRQKKYLVWSRQDILAAGLFLAYCLSGLTAVDARSAVLEALKILACLTVYTVTAHGGWSRRDYDLLLQVIFWTSCGVSLLGLGSALGAVDLAGGYVDSRVYSTFQYPNTLAAYVGAMTVLGAYLGQASQSRLGRLYSPALFLSVLCLLATGSRGGLGVFVLALPVTYVLLPRQEAGGILKVLLQNLLLGFVAALVFVKFIAAGNTAGGWAVVLTGLSGTLVLQSHKPLPKLRTKTLILALCLVVGTGLAAYGAEGNDLLHRLQAASPQTLSFQERLSYYRDGLTMILERPVQGFGGGGWALYQRFQGYPYRASNPHNNLVKVGLESGLLGAVCYLGWWLNLGITAWRKRQQGEALPPLLFAALLILGLHSMMDFDFSYGFIALLVWSCGGIVAAGAGRDSVGRPALSRYAWASCLGVVGVLLAGSAVSLTLAAQDGARATVYREQGEPLAALASLDQARARDPFAARYPAAQAEILLNSPQAANLAKAAAAVDQALALNSADPGIKGTAAKIFLARGELKKANALAEDELSFNRYNPQAYLALADFYTGLARKAREQGDPGLARAYLLAGSQLAGRLQNTLNGMDPRDVAQWPQGKPEIPAELAVFCRELADQAQKTENMQ